VRELSVDCLLEQRFQRRSFLRLHFPFRLGWGGNELHVSVRLFLQSSLSKVCGLQSGDIRFKQGFVGELHLH
jgi:hypothetical protein